MKEVWKHYIHNYEISNLGRIRNFRTGNILKTQILKSGYINICVSLGSRGSSECIKMHRAVAECFIPNPNNLPQVNHIDGCKTNNKVENLEWCTNRENTIHAIRTGLKTFEYQVGEKNWLSKLTQEDVAFIRNNYKERDKEFGCRALARRYGLHHETIRQVLNKETWK